MKIKSVYIKEFGSIRDREITLSDGLNIIEGNNESGKSTLLSFIKFMLYGLPKRAAGEVVGEKERAFSWSGGVAEGSMTVETQEGLLRIERSAKESLRAETPKIYRVETGERVHAGENPGELFFGLPLNVFESTACVRQLKCTQLDGSGLGTSIENLMVAADENTSVKKATAKLDSVRKKLMYKSRRGGEIAELEDSVHAYEMRVRNAAERSRHVREREETLESTEQIIAQTRAKIAEEKALNRAYDLRQTQIRFDALHSAEKRVETLKAQEREALDGGIFGGRLPAQTEISELAERRTRYLGAVDSRSSAERGLEELRRQRPAEDETDSHAERMTQAGGERGVLESYSAGMKKAENIRKTGVFFGALAAVLALFGGAAFAAEKILPSLLPLEGVTMVLTVIGAAALSILCVVFAVLSGVKSKKLKNESTDYARSFGCTENSREALVIRLAALRHRISERDSLDAMLSRMSDNAKGALQAEKAAFDALYEQFYSLCPGEILSESDAAERTAELLESYRLLSDTVSEIRRDIDKYSALAQERSRELSAFDEEEIRRAVTPELLEELASVNITGLRRDLEFQQAKLDSAVAKQQTAERELITLRATSEDPARLAAELDELKKQLEGRRFMLDSLTLAAESIAEASESVRRSITPMLKKQAGEHLSELTGGRYSELSISPDFTVSVQAGGVTRPVEALSSGTRDAAYLAIRLALVSVLYRAEQPVLLLDEVLSQIDDTRAKNILSMLDEHAKNGIQCLLFTCHTRESASIDAPVVRM